MTLVYFLGGVTYAEISALRHMSTMDEGRRYVVATTKVTNGDTLLGDLLEKLGSAIGPPQ